MDLQGAFHRLLGLNDGWRVVRASYEEARGRFEIEVAETPKLWEQESGRLKGEVRCYDHVPRMEWRHLNVFNKESVVICDLPRGQYLDRRESLNGTLKVYRVTPPWEGRSKHFTQDFEAFALTLMREMPVKRAGEILGETDQRLWRMLQTHVEAAYQKLEMDDVVWVGADEMNRRKGHNYLTVFADLKKKRVVFATEGKDASTWEAFADELLKHNGHPKAVLQAAIDMSPAYVKGVRENLGNAQIVFDKFHVVSDVNQAVDKVRRAESQSCASAGASLTKTRWLWRKNPENWTEKEALRTLELEEEHLQTALAYQMRLVLQGIYECPTQGQARRKFKAWCAWVHKKCAQKKHALLEPMAKAANMIENHLEGILAHWKQGLTTAFMEGLNSLFSATKRKARGYKSTRNLITMLYFVAGKLTIPVSAH
jgi:transposase